MKKLVSEIYKLPTPHVSFEVFPPKTTKGLKKIYQTIANLKSLSPDYFSVTYGAGGSTAEKSLEIASAVQNLAETTCVAHFTCVGMNRDQVKALLETLRSHGINNVIALRGDPPKGEKKFVQTEGGFAYATELVRFIRENVEWDLSVLVAGYPEGHIENPSKDKDFQFLLEKIKAGADGIVTQAFLDNVPMLEYKNKLDQAGVTIPVAAGIFPISSAKQIKKIIGFSGASVPPDLAKAIEKYQDSNEDMEKFGSDFAVRQVEELLENGIRYFHFYTMNRFDQTRDILTQLRSRFPNLTFDS